MVLLIFVLQLWGLFYIAGVQGTPQIAYHLVKPGENVFRISRIYKVPIDSLKLWNGLDQDYMIHDGMKLIISIRYQPLNAHYQSNNQIGENSENIKIHEVGEKENVFRISLLYNVPIDSIKVWNNLDDEYTVSKGKKLTIHLPGFSAHKDKKKEAFDNQVKTHLVTGDENAFRISLRYHIPIDSLKVWNNLNKNYTVYEGQHLYIENPGYNKNLATGNKAVQQDSIAMKAEIDSLQNSNSTVLPVMSQPDKFFTILLLKIRYGFITTNQDMSLGPSCS